VRAISSAGTATEAIETGTDNPQNETLHLPLRWQDKPYLREKLAPGVLARFQQPGVGSGAASFAAFDGGGYKTSYRATEFNGVILGWDEQDYFVRILQPQQYQTYDTATAAQEGFDLASSTRVPYAYMLDLGESEVHAFPQFAFGVYAALAIPVTYSCVEVLWDGSPIEPARQANLLPSHAFQELEGAQLPGALEAAGLVRSMVSLRVDGVEVPVVVPLFQLGQ